MENNDNTLGSGFTTDDSSSGFVGGSSDSGFVGAANDSGFVGAANGSEIADAANGSGFVGASGDSNQGIVSPNITNNFTDLQVLSSQGAMSIVYKGKKYGKWHIIKRIKPEYKNNPEYRRLFLQEFDNGIQLDHPNIVRLEDKGEDSEGLWYSMEYVDGRSLEQMIRNHELTSDSIKKNIILQLCDALSYVHKKQIVHRDLKPENILVTFRGDNVKILDFGLAYSDSYDDHMKKVGTPRYAAPEQMTKGNMVDQRADIYAIGLILLEMCTGDITDREAKTVQNPNFWAIIRRATQPEVENRYYNCQEIIDDLNRNIQKPQENPVPPVIPDPPKPPEPPKPPVVEPPAPKIEKKVANVTPQTNNPQPPAKKSSALKWILIILLGGGLALLLLLFIIGSSIDDDDNDTGYRTEQNKSHGGYNDQDDDEDFDEDDDEDFNDMDDEDSEISDLMNEADFLFDGKNVAAAYDLYEEILEIDPNNTKARDRKNSCQKIFDQSNLYDLTPVKGPTGKYGYVDRDGYIIVDFEYDSPKVNKNANWKDIITIQRDGKWGALSNRTKKPASEFIYDKAQWGIPNKRGFYLDITNGRRDQIYIDSNDRIIYSK